MKQLSSEENIDYGGRLGLVKNEDEIRKKNPTKQAYVLWYTYFLNIRLIIKNNI